MVCIYEYGYKNIYLCNENKKLKGNIIILMRIFGDFNFYNV